MVAGNRFASLAGRIGEESSQLPVGTFLKELPPGSILLPEQLNPGSSTPPSGILTEAQQMLFGNAMPAEAKHAVPPWLDRVGRFWNKGRSS